MKTFFSSERAIYHGFKKAKWIYTIHFALRPGFFRKGYTWEAFRGSTCSICAIILKAEACPRCGWTRTSYPISERSGR